MNIPKLEVACFNLNSAINAFKAGANRIELCDGISEGGVTPTIEVVEKARAQISIDIYVMIRPRGGDFFYSADEFEKMKQDIIRFKNIGINGFVFGILSTNNTIDSTRNKELVNLASPLPCTFHRAFDEVPDFKIGLNDVIDCGFKTILTSGLHPTAIDGCEILKELVLLAKNKITIMPGGSVRATNIFYLKEKTKAAYFHSSAIIDNTGIANIEEIKKLQNELATSK